jgi:2-polyprenyl-3-methyl-5-hydroxy-6-metoxy-1,4-benzoquinol methylase
MLDPNEARIAFHPAAALSSPAAPGPQRDGAPPRVLLFLFDFTDPSGLRSFVERIPGELDACIAEIVVMLDSPGSAPEPTGEFVPEGRDVELRFHRPARRNRHGAARKVAFEYARRKRADFAVCVSLGGEHSPESLPALLEPALAGRAELVVASQGKGLAPLRAGVSAGRWLVARVAAGASNRVLGLRVPDYHSSLRVYSSRVLQCVPFQLDADGPLFEVHTLIQARALGVEAHAVPVVPAEHGSLAPTHPLALSLRGFGAALGYRLHQLHVIRRGRYFVDHGIHYTLKQSETGSHMQIVGAIERGTRVLDLGCSQGLLARPLREKGVRVIGVDSGARERLAAELEKYFSRDLELALELPCGRSFDFVVCADVIEHLRNRGELLRSARRFLKPDGRLLISTPNIALWFYRLSLLVGRFEYGPRGVLDRTHVHLYTRDSFRREVERAGFEIARERVTALPFEVVFQSTGRSRIVRGLASVYHALARLWPELFAYQFLLEARITTLDEDATAR